MAKKPWWQHKTIAELIADRHPKATPYLLKSAARRAERSQEKAGAPWRNMKKHQRHADRAREAHDRIVDGL